MKTLEIDAFEVKGINIRTDNQSIEEIIDLWSKVGKVNLKEELYAVYSNYESDHNGKYDLLVGSLKNDLKDSIQVKEGKYLVFELEQGTPDKVGAMWQKIWQDTEIYKQRLFTTDFEHYFLDGRASIYLAIN